MRLEKSDAILILLIWKERVSRIWGMRNAGPQGRLCTVQPMEGPTQSQEHQQLHEGKEHIEHLVLFLKLRFKMNIEEAAD